MSSLGTGVAAGVAGTALQAQRVARQRDKRRADASRTADRVLEVLEVRLKGLEEDDAAEDATRLHIDPGTADHDRRTPLPELQKREQGSDGEQPPSPADTAAAAEAYGPPPQASAPQNGALYRHLDVEA